MNFFYRPKVKTKSPKCQLLHLRAARTSWGRGVLNPGSHGPVNPFESPEASLLCSAREIQDPGPLLFQGFQPPEQTGAKRLLGAQGCVAPRSAGGPRGAAPQDARGVGGAAPSPAALLESIEASPSTLWVLLGFGAARCRDGWPFIFQIFRTARGMDRWACKLQTSKTTLLTLLETTF